AENCLWGAVPFGSVPHTVVLLSVVWCYVLLSVFSGGVLLSRRATPRVPSALAGLTSVFGMGTGVTLPPSPPKPGCQRRVPNGDAALRALHSEHEHLCRSKPSAD